MLGVSIADVSCGAIVRGGRVSMTVSVSVKDKYYQYIVWGTTSRWCHCARWKGQVVRVRIRVTITGRIRNKIWLRVSVMGQHYRCIVWWTTSRWCHCAPMCAPECRSPRPHPHNWSCRPQWPTESRWAYGPGNKGGVKGGGYPGVAYPWVANASSKKECK